MGGTVTPGSVAGHSRRRLVLLSCLAALAGCGTNVPGRNLPEYTGPPDIASRWQTYADFVNEAPLQADCRPRLMEPATGTYRGTVLLFHGFSACPQQYFEMAEIFVQRGYRVLLPLLPGHGAVPPTPGGDDVAFLPVAGQWRETYGRVAEEMNAIMALAEGERVIGGLSAGAAVSVYANLQARDLYDRHILFSPYFSAATGKLGGSIVRLLARTPGLRSISVKPFGLKNACLDRRRQGRAGFCNYRIAHVGGFDELAQDNIRVLAMDDGRTEPIVRYQLVGVESDPTVSNEVIRELLELAAGERYEGVCFYPDGTPHSLFARKDNPGVDMVWLDGLLANTTSFITEGSFFPAGGPSESEDNWPLCSDPVGSQPVSFARNRAGIPYIGQRFVVQQALSVLPSHG